MPYVNINYSTYSMVLCTQRNLEINDYNFSHKIQIFNHNGHMRLPIVQSPWTSGKTHVIAKNV